MNTSYKCISALHKDEIINFKSELKKLILDYYVAYPRTAQTQDIIIDNVRDVVQPMLKIGQSMEEEIELFNTDIKGE